MRFSGLILRSCLAGAVLLVAPAAAQDLKEPPEYYLDAVMDFTMAEQLARSCATLSVRPDVMQARSAEVLAQLEADGFDTTRADAGMTDPTTEILARQQAFVERHSLPDAPGEPEVCAAGMAEIAAASQMGSFLMEVGG